jgi:hypothetical protein
MTRRGQAAALLAMPDGSERFIVRLDTMGVTEIDRAPDLRDLRLRGTRLHWLHEGAPRSARAAHGRRCGPAHGATPVALTKDVRVYYIYSALYDEEYYDYFACLRPGGKPIKLTRTDQTIYSGSSSSTDDVKGLAFAGPLLAFSQVGCGLGNCYSTVTVVDVGRRRKVRKESVGGDAVDVVVSAKGSAAALVAYEYSGGLPSDSAVLKFDAAGQTQLDHGPDVHSLTFDGSLLHWLSGSEERSAPLD